MQRLRPALFAGDSRTTPRHLSYLGKTLYIGGYGWATGDLLQFADDIQAHLAAITAMKDLCAKTLDPADNGATDVVCAGLCYRLLVSMGRPLITQPPLDRITWPQKVPKSTEEAFYLNTRHGSDGVTLRPGGGKIMCDLAYGRKPTVEISRLGLVP